MLHIKKIKPLFTGILTTGERYSEDVRDNGVIIANKGDLKVYQKVLEVGSSVRDIKAGDMVMIDMLHFAQLKYNPNSVQNDFDNNKVTKWNIPWVVLDDEDGNPQDCLLIDNRDVKFVFEGEERQSDDAGIILPKKGLILS